MIWYSHLFQNFPQFIVIHTVKGSGIVNKAEVDVFLELSCFVDDLKDGLKLYIQKTKIMASSPITSWKIYGETMEKVTDFISLASKSLQLVTPAMKLKDACSVEEKLWPT